MFVIIGIVVVIGSVVFGFLMEKGKMKETKIIIKKVKKRSEKGSHGGQWKVAYADFVTALMAFFLLLWLISMIAPEKRARVAHYFKHFTLFERSGQSFMDKSSEIFNPNPDIEIT
jgi:hypothetical protein